ncbi:ABC transporter permease [Clostridium hydrogenum]|uniref:ABC transporter permease n=1 Tax=Clostridium hydrogenum TaxID=2855764 RepID=UPI001F17720D|nr:FtsX-like permease family protein [Clostridium hydrogenum]
MIKSYKQLTGRYLKANKKRSVLTIIGIALSVALIATIGFFLKGIQAAETQTMIDNYGSWEVSYQRVDSSLLSKIKSNPKVSMLGLFQNGDEIKLQKGVTLKQQIVSDEALKLLPYKLKSGRFPNGGNEIVIENWVLKYLKSGTKIGDTVNLGNKKYKLVGILQDCIQSQDTNKGIMFSKTNNIDLGRATLLVRISPKTNLKKAVNELNTLAPKKTIADNTYVIDLEGGGNDSNSKAMYGTVGVIIAIVVIATIAVIYNSFQISVVERIRQFGLLRAVGMTPKQLRRMVLGEASILAAISIPIGLILGVIAINCIGIAFKLIGGDNLTVMKISISSSVIVISAVVGVISVYLSAMLPAYFAGRISPLVAISSRAAITKEKIKRRKSTVLKLLFGFEGNLASKNIKRNKKRYRITVFSIVISVVLFVTFKSFMDMALNLNGSSNEVGKMQLTIMNNDKSNQNAGIDDEVIKAVSKLDTVKNVYKSYNVFWFKEYFDTNIEINDVKRLGSFYKRENLNGKEKTMFNQSSVSVYDDNSMKSAQSYLDKGKIDIDELNKENGVIVINKNNIYDAKTGKMYKYKILNIKPGDEIYLKYLDKTKGAEAAKKVKVIAVLKDDPFNPNFSPKGVKLITTESVIKNLTGISSIKPAGAYIRLKDAKSVERAQTEIETAIKSQPSLKVINDADVNREMNSLTLMIEILIYGFVIVVSLIGSVNIINTLTTNIILRKREFATLKAIGFTQKGLKKMIVLEGVLYGIVGTIYGSIIASGLSYLMYKSMISIQEFKWNIPWEAIGIAGVAAIIIGYVSVLSPLSRIKKENIIETIREEN